MLNMITTLFGNHAKVEPISSGDDIRIYDNPSSNFSMENK